MAAGGLLALGHAPFSIPYFVLIALPLLAVLLMGAETARAGFRIGWCVGVAYFAGSMFWIVEPFFVEPEIYGWMSPFALVFLAGGLALFWGLGFGLAARIAQGRWRLLALAAGLTGAEFLRAHIFTGFPWGLLAYVWSDTPVFQFLALVGPHGLGFLTILAGVAPMALAPIWQRGLVALLAFPSLWLIGELMTPNGPVPLRDFTVRIVQPNAPQHLKWHPDHIAKFFQRGLALSAGYGAPVDILIWPETSIPFSHGSHPQGMALLKEAANGAHFIGGIQRRDEALLFNTLLHVDRQGQVAQVYDKQHLVPFGEYVPLADLASRFGFHGMAARDGMGFAAGSGPRRVAVDEVPPYVPLICYEAIFPAYAQTQGARPDWLVHITNDAWFGNFSGPYQHLVQARARAIEQGLPVARAANTGVSAMIDPYGRIVRALPLNTDGFMDVQLPVTAPVALYSRLGEWPWLLLATLAMGAVALGHRPVASRRE